jgi:putative tryptophan/tyrosine transport system substrate-binding protein
MPPRWTKTIALATALTAVCLSTTALNVHGQPQGRTYRVGVLLFSSPTEDPNMPVLREALRAAGYVEGRNLTLEFRYAEGKPERLKAFAEDLAQLRPDLIYAVGGDVVPFAKNATQTIPIVGLMSLDPVRAGIVPSLAHPGGNLTGFTFLLSELAGKRLEFLREVMPRLSRVAVVWNPDHPDPDFKDTQAAASRLGIRLQSIEVRKLDDFEGALAMATRDRAEAIIVVSSRLMFLRQSQILDFAAKNRIPIATGFGAWVQNGALFSYGPNSDDIVRQSVSHVDKILKGAKPADLPIEQPTRFELVLNLKTARTLNLTVPQSLIARADRVIE